MTSHLPVHAVVLVIAILSATLHAEDASPLSLENILELHSQHLDRLKTGDITYVVTRPSQPGDPLSTETYRVTINGSFEASRLDGQAKPEQCWWDGAAFGRTIGLDLSGPKLGVDSILKASGTIYRYDLPVKRLFSWRSLRSYRLFASDHDLSLRVLCEQSPDKRNLTTGKWLDQVVPRSPGMRSA